MPSDDKLDWARLDMQRFECCANVQLRALSAQADYAMKMSQVQEQLIKNESDKVKLAILEDSFADFKRTRHVLLAKIEAKERQAARIVRHTKWLRYLAMGEALPQDQVTHVWSAFYYFMTEMSEPALKVPTGARLREHYVHTPPPDKDVPSTAMTPWAYILWLRAKNWMPRSGTEFLYQVIEAMVAEATRSEAAAETDAAKAGMALSALQNQGPKVA